MKWGSDAFKFNPQVLTNYIQSSRGVIGSSSYRQWAEELEQLCDRDLPGEIAPLLEPIIGARAAVYRAKSLQGKNIPAFQAAKPLTLEETFLYTRNNYPNF